MLAYNSHWLSQGNTQRQSLQQLLAILKQTSASDFMKLESEGDPSRISLEKQRVSKYPHLEVKFWQPKHPDKCHLHLF
jgi:hypothetical protein